MVRLVIRLRSEWLVFPRSPQTFGKFFPGRPKAEDCRGTTVAAPCIPGTPRPAAPAVAPARNFLRSTIRLPQLQKGRLPMADRIPLTMCFLKKACPTYPEPSVHAAESWPSAVTQDRPPS